MARDSREPAGSVIYLDYQATTPLAPEARAAMLPWLDGPDGQGFGNPHSPHRMGRAAAAAVEAAREQVAMLLPPGGRVVFTGSPKPKRSISQSSAPVRDRSRCLRSNMPPYWIPCKRRAAHATCSPAAATVSCPLDAPIPAGTGLVAVMQVNNEIGTVQPVAEIAKAAHEAGALFLCDAVQGAGKLAPPAAPDLIALSAHKLYGPKGIGALWVRDGVTLSPLIHGGGQEQGLRSGTLSPALCAGFGAAAKLSLKRIESDAAHVEGLWVRAREMLSGWVLNGSPTLRWRGNLNLRREGLDVARLMSDLRDIAFSAGSACASGSGRPSHVLQAIGLDEKAAKSSVRLGFGRYTTLPELEDACARLEAAAAAQGVLL